MMKENGLRFCDRCGVLLRPDNNKKGFEICDECNEWLERTVKEPKVQKGEKARWVGTKGL